MYVLACFVDKMETDAPLHQNDAPIATAKFQPGFYGLSCICAPSQAK